MKWTLLTVVVVVGACVISLSTSAPTTAAPLSNSKAATSSPEPKSVEDGKKKAVTGKNGKINEMNADDSNVRKKKSEEFIQFGNQQNKPAGMVDDALSGIATKKNLDKKRQQNFYEGIGQQMGSNDDVSEDDNGAENEPLSSLMVNDDKGPIRSEDNPYMDEGELDSGSYLGSPTNPMESQLQDDGHMYQGLREQTNDRLNGEWFGREDEFGNRRRRRNIVRNDRNFRKRSLRTTAEKLMNMNGGARRWKRDVRLHEDDVLGFLSLLAAAELAKEKEDRQHELERLPFPSTDSDYLWPSRNGYLDDDQTMDGIGIDNYGYYYPGQPFDVDVISKMMDNKESPEIVVLNPDELASMKRSFYPAVDYRSLGIIGARKRRRQQQQFPLEMDDESTGGPHYGGSWGRIRGSWPSLRRVLSDYNSMDDDSDTEETSESGESAESTYGGRNQQRDQSETDKLYTLGELLNGKSEVEDYRYPLYKRLI